MENTKSTKPTPITNAHVVRMSGVNLIEKESPSSNRYKVSISSSKTDDSKVIQDVMPLRMIVPVGIFTTKSKAADSKKKKAPIMVSPSKNDPSDFSVTEKIVGKDHMDRTK